MDDAFRCLGEAARAALSAIARHLRLRTNVFDHLLDDTPLPFNEVSSSELLVAYSNQQHLHSGHVPTSAPQVDRGFLMLVASDHPGIEVCDPNGQWYLADGLSGPGDLLLLTGRALSHVTAGLRQTSRYRITNESRGSLTFRLMPRANAILDCSPISAAGHCVPQMYQSISASQFMDDLCAEEHAISNHSEAPSGSQGSFVSEPSLRSVLSDPLSGAFLEDAMVLLCGHSFGGLMLKKVIEMARCTICNGEVDPATLFPNLALRAVATVVKMEDDRRLFHNAALRKRRKEGNGELLLDTENSPSPRGVQYPFVVGERVLIMGNRRTPDKFIGKEAVITSQCLNGWYLVKAVDSGESIRLQYRSLKKVSELQPQSEMRRLQPLTFLHNKYPSGS
uniref:PUB 62/63 C-terminal domain-containing protein n=1 Tax=Leersia perrieri TaxID=77586 RepID=A0A0D9VN05_9ORYZ